ncbi:uncharacterized protein LOC142225293 [Haematobia irritans]|uniref:uncharacterized protein LOC142225293 n=1 Tax=Haematobia irritans TaxID=7368 RepID=UPI003F505162
MSLPAETKRWFLNYLRGRQSYGNFSNKKSRLRRVKPGVPQGGVIYPSLINLYLSSIPPPSGGVEIVSYVDDCFTTWTAKVRRQLNVRIYPKFLGSHMTTFSNKLCPTVRALSKPVTRDDRRHSIRSTMPECSRTLQ